MDTRQGGEDGVDKRKVDVGEFAESLMLKSNEDLLLGESHSKVNCRMFL